MNVTSNYFNVRKQQIGIIKLLSCSGLRRTHQKNQSSFSKISLSIMNMGRTSKLFSLKCMLSPNKHVENRKTAPIPLKTSEP